MGRWTQYEEDAHRLPHGMKRVGYDADTRVYTFQDRDGRYYHSAPGEEYGILRPVRGVVVTRPGAFDTGRPPKLNVNTKDATKTFQEFLPADVITSPSTSIETRHERSQSMPLRFMTSSATRDQDSPTSPLAQPPPRAVFMAAVKKATLPKMQGVVENLRRSVTTVRRNPADGRGGGGGSLSGTHFAGGSRRHVEDDTAALLRRGSKASTLTRSSTVSSGRSSTSTVTAVREVPRRRRDI
ncbi:hypothetical protein AX16_010522 [Volvariella volvacea WC 439]|nr:hypothetical protein AX16_010522 [Volvariella volvacea WC 439]